jgi:Domain of unknown function (DUF4190)
MTCARCGAKASPGATFCGTCGNPLTAPSVAPPPIPPPPPYRPPAPQSGRTNGLSIASLVLGILWIWGLGAILALIFGFTARKQIQESNGRQGGGGLATAGIVLGIVGILGAILLTVGIAVTGTSVRNSVRSSLDIQAACTQDFTSVQTAVETYFGQVGHNPTSIRDLMGTTKGVGGTTVGPWLTAVPASAGHYQIEVSSDGSGTVSVYTTGSKPTQIGSSNSSIDCAALAPVPPASSGALQTWWNSGVSADFQSLADGYTTLGVDNAVQNLTAVGTDCLNISNYAHALENDNPVPDPSLNSRWQSGLGLIAAGGSDCSNAAESGDSQQVQTAVSNLNAAYASLSQVTGKAGFSTVPTTPGSTAVPTTTIPVTPIKTPAYVLPTPDGYEVETGNGTTNGPITPSVFDQHVGSGAAEAAHFVSGYDITYSNKVTDESIESTLLTFSSPADAAGFEPALITNAGSANLAPVKSTLGSIPGSTLLTSTKAGSDGFYVIDLFAIKGSTVMVIEYANDGPPNGVPDVLRTSAIQQYNRL